MKIIRPVEITPAILTSNVPETLPEYSPAATYSLGQQVRDAAANRAYQSVVSANIGHALTDPSKWLDLGPTNRWAMFDQVNGTATTAAGGIDVTLALTGRADGLALIDVVGQQVQVTVTAGGVTLYDQVTSLVADSGITTWYDWFTEPIARNTVFDTSALPLNVNPTVRIQVTDSSGAAVSIGSLVIGQTFDLGTTIFPAKSGIRDYSRIEADAFGNYTIVPRAFSRRQTVKTAVDAAKVDIVQDYLTRYRSTPLVWIGSETYNSLVSFGFVRDWSVDVSTPVVSYLTLEIEGLT